MSETKQDVTNVQEVDVNIDEFLGFGADSVMTANEGTAEEKKPNVFSPMDVDTSFLDKPVQRAPQSVEEPEKPAGTAQQDPPANENSLNDPDDLSDPLAPPSKNTPTNEAIRA